jgi:hypothetical protein
MEPRSSTRPDGAADVLSNFRGTAIEVIELEAFFRDPTAWALPRRMYVHREISPFVPSRLRVMYDGEPDWSVLPSPAREIVSSNLQTLIRDGCQFISTDQAR